MTSKKSVLLSRRQKFFLYSAFGLLWITGLPWLWMSPSVWRTMLMEIHGAAAMGFLLCFGAVLLQHVPAGLKQPRQRPSGFWLLSGCWILVVTGWGLYYLGNEPWRQAASWIHRVVGALIPLLILTHIWLVE